MSTLMDRYRAPPGHARPRFGAAGQGERFGPAATAAGTTRGTRRLAAPARGPRPAGTVPTGRTAAAGIPTATGGPAGVPATARGTAGVPATRRRFGVRA